MNKEELKQELIEKLKELERNSPYTVISNKGDTTHTSKSPYGAVMELVCQLDKPEKVKIPKFVAEWIERHKNNYLKWDNSSKADFIFRAINDLFRYGEGLCAYDFYVTDKISKWTTKNAYSFIKAILDGYEIEKEPLYYVKLIDGDEGYLNKDLSSEEFFISDNKPKITQETKFTEKEIKAIDERYWQFAVKVEDDD